MYMFERAKALMQLFVRVLANALGEALKDDAYTILLSKWELFESVSGARI